MNIDDPTPSRPWDEDRRYSIVDVPAQGYISNPKWARMGAIYSPLGKFGQRQEENTIFVDHIPGEFGVAAAHLSGDVRNFGYLLTGIIFRLTERFEFPDAAPPPDHFEELRALSRKLRPDFAYRPPNLTRWPKDSEFWLCGAVPDRVQEMVSVHASGAFLILGREPGYEVVLADVVENLREHLCGQLADRRVRAHQPAFVAWQLSTASLPELLVARQSHKQRWRGLIP